MTVLDFYTTYANYYHKVLLNNKQALGYLRSRGISVNTIGKFKLGYCDGSFGIRTRVMYPEYPNLVYNKELLNNSHLFIETAGYKEKFINYIIIPVIENGEIVYFTARFLGNGEKNHLHLNGTLPCPYNIDTLGSADTLYIVESPIDAMLLEQAGFNAIAIFTSSTIKSIFIKKIINFRGRIVLLFDNDLNLAGQKGSYRCADELMTKANLNSYIATPPFLEGNKKTDVNILYLSNKAGFKSTINQITEEALSYKDTKYFLQKEKERSLQKQRVELRKETSELIQQVKLIPITDVVSRYIKIDKTGFGGIAYCPWHEDVKTKSLLLYNNSNMFFCMSGACNAHGDAIEFVRKYFNLTFKNAIRKILEE